MLKFIKGLFEKPKYHILKNEEFNRMLKSANKPVILDVRSKPEFDREKIHGAMNIDLMNPNFSKKIHHFNKQKIYFVYCQGNLRSRRACKKLIKAGFKEVYRLKGGMSSWTGRTV